MRKAIQLSSKLKYLGLLGLPMVVSDLAIWRFMWLFWLFGIVEIILTFPVFCQQLYQLWGLIGFAFKKRSAQPDSDLVSNLEYSLPFAGEWLVLNGGINCELSHSWELYSQRYAYDFIKVNEQVESVQGDRTVLENYYCYAQMILAPADGIVQAISDRCADSKIMPDQSTDPLIKDIRGNFIVMKHAEQEYSVLCHLKPQSIRVQPGDFVKRLQPIAQCGNSGNTSEPHLHFQVQNSKNFFMADGIKIRFQAITGQPQPDYATIDPRPVLKEDALYIGQPFIHRGLRVMNQSAS